MTNDKDDEPGLDDFKRYLLGATADAVSDLFYYNRKGCEDLSIENVDDLIDQGGVTLKEIVSKFESEILRRYPDIKRE